MVNSRSNIILHIFQFSSNNFFFIVLYFLDYKMKIVNLVMLFDET